MASILITGGTGLIGKQLTSSLQNKGHKVSILSRNTSKKPNVYQWSINDSYIENEAILNADYIIHLAGAGIADKRWTKTRKKELIDSRVDSTNLLFNKIQELNHNLKGFIAASGIGYYGATTSSTIYSEKDAPGNDFISKICKLWEKASLKFSTIDVRTVILRTGIVLSNKGGALPKIVKPIKLGFGAALGKGNQYMPWIHIDDLCNMYVEAIENNKIEGIYNAVSPSHVNNIELTNIIATYLKKKILLPNVPSFVFKILYGEMSKILLEGSRVSSKKVEKTGFKFKHSSTQDTIKNILTNY
ncbi:MAG: TIGR01777 family protein [Lutibacter sp.]|uniref:TIGR01777 family oxidoreductase n=1 Tax=Lutibacter sp. TaxID=1925666 RepID=UPI001818412C|nr:TIGR01777 family oxidoreductase [Lutibacter sp.]MBT8317503.1 TIGR01777 family oxidoreductase [Lutibacter sp.]NNJ58362.1 TIGR01777 family protein [Lutibacter sp.]